MFMSLSSLEDLGGRRTHTVQTEVEGQWGCLCPSSILKGGGHTEWRERSRENRDVYVPLVPRGSWKEDDTHCGERGRGKIGTFMSLSSLEDLAGRTHSGDRGRGKIGMFMSLSSLEDLEGRRTDTVETGVEGQWGRLCPSRPSSILKGG